MMNKANNLDMKDKLWDLNISRIFNSSVEDVFKAWTTPELLLEWFCNDGNAQFDITEGGEFNLSIVCETDGIAELTGKYVEIVKNKKLVFTWIWKTPPLSEAGETLVTVEFIDLGGRTEIRLFQQGFSTEEFSKNHVEGWNLALNRFEKTIN